MDTTSHNLPPAGIRDIRNDILVRAEHLLHYNNLLIRQCDNWLSAEEGNRIMEQRIIQRNRAIKNPLPSATVKTNY